MARYWWQEKEYAKKPEMLEKKPGNHQERLWEKGT